MERYRFAHYQPQGVTAMALSTDKKLLAVCRESGSIEIWLKESWSQLMVIPGNTNCPIRNIHWLEQSTAPVQGEEHNPMYLGGKKRRLVTTGINGTVIEWDLLNKSIRCKYTVHSAIWDSKLKGKLLHLACEDGSIKIVKVKKDKIELHRTLVKAETRCLSIDLSSDSKFIFGGYADSSIRKWDLESGNCTLHFQKQTKSSK